MVSKVLHTCTAGIYRNFFNQSASQQVLKVALPLIALGAAGLYLHRRWTATTQITPPPKSGTTEANPNPAAFTYKCGLPSQIPANEQPPQLMHTQIYGDATGEWGETQYELNRNFAKYRTGVKPGVTDSAAAQASQRWMCATNFETYLDVDGTCYPGNQFSLSAQGPKYILAESPSNSDVVDWTPNSLEILFKTNCQLWFCRASPFFRPDTTAFSDIGKDFPGFHLEQYSFVSHDRPFNTPNLQARCINPRPIQVTDDCYANLLKITYNGITKNVWQLFVTESPGNRFADTQEHVGMLNTFIKEQKITVDQSHPLLVSCRTGKDRSATLLLFYQLQLELESYITNLLSSDPSMSEDTIVEEIIGEQDITAMLLQRAQVIESLSTSGAATESMERTVIKHFNGDNKGTIQDVNEAYKAHVRKTIQKMR